MIHHPLILGPKLVVLALIIIALIILHGILPPDQFRIAVVVSAAGFLVFVVALWIVAFKLISNPDSKMSKATVLSSQHRAEDGFAAPSRESEVDVGTRGSATSGLRPSGIAIIDGKRIPVVTSGEFISTGAEVEVVEVKGGRVVVRESKDDGK